MIGSVPDTAPSMARNILNGSWSGEVNCTPCIIRRLLDDGMRRLQLYVDHFPSVRIPTFVMSNVVSQQTRQNGRHVVTAVFGISRSRNAFAIVRSGQILKSRQSFVESSFE